MFLIRRDRAYFALFRRQLQILLPEYLEALEVHSLCAACKEPVDLRWGCDCKDALDDKIHRSIDSLFHASLGMEDYLYERNIYEPFNDLLGIYFIDRALFDEAVDPLFKKHLRRMIYQPRSSKLRAERISASKSHYCKEHVTWLDQEQRGECYFCGSDLNGSYHVDHLLPLALGGDNSFENIALLCVSCNQSKHSKTESEFWRVTKKILSSELYRRKKEDARKVKKKKVSFKQI